MDPFDTLPIKMPFKSRELFHYFYQVGEAFGVMPRDRMEDCVALVAHDPCALRNTLLIAGVHYAWNAGKLQDYESTFLFHKVESMRMVNGWLADSHARATALCVRQIATLCFAECCLGNLTTAETHLDGLMAFMEIREPQEGSIHDIKNVDEELADRYLILAYNFVHGLKSRFNEVPSFYDPTGPIRESAPDEVASAMKTWHKEETGGLNNRLKAMRMFPHFFGLPPPGRQPRDIDAYPIISCLESITRMIDHRQLSPPADGRTPPSSHVWNDGGPTRLLLAFVNTHVLSLSRRGEETVPGGKPRQRFMSAWSGVATTAGLYLNCVLDLWNAGQTMESRLHRRVLLILKRDIDRAEQGMRDQGGTSRDLWFWKVFTGALSLAKAQRGAYDITFRLLETRFDDCIRSWSEAANVTQWVEARGALARVVWPDIFLGEAVAEALWETATRSE